MTAALGDVTASGEEEHAARYAGARFDRQQRAARKLAGVTTLRTVVLGAGAWAPILLVLAYGPRLGATPGVVLGTLAYVMQSLTPALFNLASGLGESGVRLWVTLTRLRAALPPPAPETRRRRGGAHRAEGVTFAYGPQALPVVDRLDLVIAEGEHLAVVGPSGIGKSTLAALIAGLIAPDQGRVIVGGVPAARVDRRQRVLIPQEAYIFRGTVAENLGDHEPRKLRQALDAVGAGHIGLQKHRSRPGRPAARRPGQGLSRRRAAGHPRRGHVVPRPGGRGGRRAGVRGARRHPDRRRPPRQLGPAGRQGAGHGRHPRRHRHPPGTPRRLAPVRGSGRALGPPTQAGVMIEIIHGHVVSDPYRWLEDPGSDETRAWQAQQEAVWQSQLLPDRDRFRARIDELSDTGVVGAPIWRGGTAFRIRRDPGRRLPVLYADDRPILDPEAIDPGATTLLEAWHPSPDGALVAAPALPGRRRTQRALRHRRPDRGPRRRPGRGAAPLAGGLAAGRRRLLLRPRPPGRVHRLGGDDLDVADADGIALSADGRWLTLSVNRGRATTCGSRDLAGPARRVVQQDVAARSAVAVGGDGRAYMITTLDAPGDASAWPTPPRPTPSATWSRRTPKR